MCICRRMEVLGTVSWDCRISYKLLDTHRLIMQVE